MPSEEGERHESLPNPTDGEYRPGGPAKGEDISPSKTDFQGPLAHLDTPRSEFLMTIGSGNESDKALGLLMDGGMEENEARSLLNLELRLTAETDPRPNVHYYEAPEVLETQVEGWTNKDRDRLVEHLHRTISNAATDSDAAVVIARMFEHGVSLGMQKDPFASGDSPPSLESVTATAPATSVCGVCGAVVADMNLHNEYTHNLGESDE